jgi:hypothetical protein
MPVLMLETTLRFLYEELVKTAPDKKAFYEKLLEAAEALFKERTKQISESEVARLAGDFEAAVGKELADHYKNTGRLLMSAVADEKNGREGAVSALQTWLTDPDRFSRSWISAVNDIVRKAIDFSDRNSN